MEEILRELSDTELDAVSGGAVNLGAAAASGISTVSNTGAAAAFADESTPFVFINPPRLAVAGSAAAAFVAIP
jgi:hypothetical protein